MSRAKYKVYSQADFSLAKSWELVYQYLRSEKVGHSEETARSALNEFRGVVVFNHQTQSVQDRFGELDFAGGKPAGLPVEEFAPLELHELAKADLLTYIEYLNAKVGKHGKLLRPVTKKGYYESVNSFLNWVEDEFEETFENPCISSKRAMRRFERAGAQPKSKTGKYVPHDKLAHVLYIAEHNYTLDVYVLFLLLVHSPPRKSELLTTKRANVFLSPDLNYLESGFESGAMKEGNVLFFFPPEVARVMRSYLLWLDVTYSNSEYLFPAMRQGGRGYRSAGWLTNIIRDMRAKTGFHFSAHWFRHTIITNRLHALGRCKERCPASISEKLMNHAPSGTEAQHYDQLSLRRRGTPVPQGLDPTEELKKDYKEYLFYHPYDRENLTFRPKK